jgi:hypothetical protein
MGKSSPAGTLITRNDGLESQLGMLEEGASLMSASGICEILWGYSQTFAPWAIAPWAIDIFRSLSSNVFG